MGECGCGSIGWNYKMAAPAGYYVIQFYPGCTHCDTAPGMLITLIGRDSIWWRDVEAMPDLPFSQVDDCSEAAIVTGLSPDEFNVRAREHLTGWEIERDAVDDIEADVMADKEMWDAVSRVTPHLPRAQGEEDGS